MPEDWSFPKLEALSELLEDSTLSRLELIARLRRAELCRSVARRVPKFKRPKTGALLFNFLLTQLPDLGAFEAELLRENVNRRMLLQMWQDSRNRANG